jgi:hypothetical protein
MTTSKRSRALPVLNLESATFECVWPGCGGACCKESRPPISPGEEARIASVVERGGWKTRRIKSGRPTLAVAARYCVFYAEGCALHRLGASEGDKNKYKPGTCITFPLDRDDHDAWYVRQRGYASEEWDLDCLDPKSSTRKPADSLAEEIEFAERADAGLEAWRK